MRRQATLFARDRIGEHLVIAIVWIGFTIDLRSHSRHMEDLREELEERCGYEAPKPSSDGTEHP